MQNERTENIFYLDLKHVHKYGCAKFQKFLHNKRATESAAEEKKQKTEKSRQPLKDGIPQLNGPSYRVNWPASPVHADITSG